MEFEINERQQLVVWVYNTKNIQMLKRYGYVLYASNKMKYVILYIDKNTTSQAIKQIQKMHFVRSVDVSSTEKMSMNFQANFNQYRDEMAKIAEAQRAQNEDNQYTF